MIKPKKNPVTKLVAAGVKAVAKAAGKKATKPLTNPKSAVKTVAADRSGASKFNQGSLMRATDAATGAAARKGAARLGVTGKKGVQPPIKINTDPTKPKGIFGPLKKKAAAADTPANRAKAANNARALKAANKGTKKMQNVPAGVSARFAATNARLAREAAKKNKAK